MQYRPTTKAENLFARKTGHAIAAMAYCSCTVKNS